jgi:hypothetical protein
MSSKSLGASAAGFPRATDRPGEGRLESGIFVLWPPETEDAHASRRGKRCAEEVAPAELVGFDLERRST